MGKKYFLIVSIVVISVLIGVCGFNINRSFNNLSDEDANNVSDIIDSENDGVIAYVDGVTQNKFPVGCNYSVTYEAYVGVDKNNDISIPFSCDSTTGIWSMEITGTIPTKIRVWFTSK